MEGTRDAEEDEQIDAPAADAHGDERRPRAAEKGEPSGAAEKSEPSGAAEKSEPSGAPEREAYGPLDIERHRKHDGRALILYTVAERGKE